jgi:hypothetical protein
MLLAQREVRLDDHVDRLQPRGYVPTRLALAFRRRLVLNVNIDLDLNIFVFLALPGQVARVGEGPARRVPGRGHFGAVFGFGVAATPAATAGGFSAAFPFTVTAASSLVFLVIFICCQRIVDVQSFVQVVSPWHVLLVGRGLVQERIFAGCGLVAFGTAAAASTTASTRPAPLVILFPLARIRHFLDHGLQQFTREAGLLLWCDVFFLHVTRRHFAGAGAAAAPRGLAAGTFRGGGTRGTLAHRFGHRQRSWRRNGLLLGLRLFIDQIRLGDFQSQIAGQTGPVLAWLPKGPGRTRFTPRRSVRPGGDHRCRRRFDRRGGRFGGHLGRRFRFFGHFGPQQIRQVPPVAFAV